MAARAAWCVAIAAAVATVVVTAEAVAEGSVASAAGAPDAGAHQKAWGPHTGSPFFRSRLSGSDGGASFLSALASAHSLAAGPSLRQLRTPRAPTRDDLDEEAAGDERLSTAAAGTLGDRIDRLLAPTVAASRAGAAYAVARRGVTIASGAAGVANVALGVPLAINSLTDVASVSKQMTAFLIYWLADRGRLSLDDDVRRHVPELPAYAHTVTLRHMVHHVSGLLDCILSVTLSGVTSADALPRPALLAAIARQQRLRFRPGSCFEYSNTNYVLAALVAERVSGTPFRTLLRRVIFEPLGMDDSDVYDSPVRVYPQMAASYSFNVTPPAVPGRQPVEELTVATDQRAFVGASGVVTAPTDLLRWASVFRNNSLGGGAALIKEMETPAVLRYPNGTVRPPTYAFGLGAYAGGLFVTDLPVNGSPVRLVHHPGGIGGYRSMFLRVPAAELVVVLQTTSALFADVFGLATGIAALAVPELLSTGGEGGAGGGTPTDPPRRKQGPTRPRRPTRRVRRRRRPTPPSLFHARSSLRRRAFGCSMMLPGRRAPLRCTYSARRLRRRRPSTQAARTLTLRAASAVAGRLSSADATSSSTWGCTPSRSSSPFRRPSTWAPSAASLPPCPWTYPLLSTGATAARRCCGWPRRPPL